jgi:hypothetical protein
MDNPEVRSTLNRVVGTLVEKDCVRAPTYAIRVIAVARR